MTREEYFCDICNELKHPTQDLRWPATACTGELPTCKDCDEIVFPREPTDTPEGEAPST